MMRNMDPGESDIAIASFRVPRNATSLTAYEFCNLHGLWQGPTVFVNKSETNARPSGFYVLWGAIAGAAASVLVSCMCASWFYVRFRNARKAQDVQPKKTSPVASPKRL